MKCKGPCKEDKDPKQFPADYPYCYVCQSEKNRRGRENALEMAEARTRARSQAITREQVNQRIREAFQPERVVLPNPFQKTQSLAQVSAFGMPARQVRKGSHWEVG